MASSTVTPGTIIIVLGNAYYMLGAFIADWSETHVLNPRWPPHAKFHNGQTMSLSILLAIASSYFALKPAVSAVERRHDVFWAAFIGSFYCLAGLSAIFYPGTDWQDPEFADFNGAQRYIFVSQIVMVWLGYAVELREDLGSRSRRVRK